MKWSLVLLLLVIQLTLLPAAPTESRAWRSTVGSSLEARATALDGAKVTLETGDGRVVKLDLNRLVEEDQEFLRDHFGSAAGGTGAGPATGNAAQVAGLPYPLGAINPELTTPEGVRYLVYLPKSLREGREYAMIFHTEAKGGGKHVIEEMKEGGELCQMIVVSTRQQRKHSEEAGEFVAACLAWTSEMKAEEPARAYSWIKLLDDELDLSGANRDAAGNLLSELAGDELNQQHAKGLEDLEDLDEFARDHLTKIPTTSIFGYNTEAGERAATRLAKKYTGVPWIETVAANLAKPTDRKGGKKKKK